MAKLTMQGRYLTENFVKTNTGGFNVCLFTINGETRKLVKSKFYKGELVPGNHYNLETYQKEGTKTVYINKAEPITSSNNATPINTTYSDPNLIKPDWQTKVMDIKKQNDCTAAIEAHNNKDRMTKKDWQAKDDLIKWEACFKAICEFHKHRPESTIHDVIEDSQLLYIAEPTGILDGIETGVSKEKEVIPENIEPVTKDKLDDEAGVPF